MSMYDELEDKIQESAVDEAIDVLQALWREGVDMDHLTSCLVEPACAGLQLRFDTPHALICLDSLSQLLHVIPVGDHLHFLEGFVRYLAGLPKLSLKFGETDKLGTLGMRQAKKGYVRSLKEHKVNNAFYYALRFVEEEGVEAFLHQCLEIAAHEVDFLGHVFIYTHTLSRLCRRLEPRRRQALIFQITEFLTRRAQLEVEGIHREGREFDAIIPLALEKINILGHNTILAHKINQAADHMEGRYIEHLCSQLVRNVENSQDSICRENLEEMIGGVKDKTADPLGALKKSLARGKDRESIYYCRLYLEDFGLTGELRSVLSRLLTARDPLQPHFLIFPQAVFDLAQFIDPSHLELALARVIRMICELD